VPGSVKVKEKLSSVSSAFDLSSRAAEVTVCGMSSSLRQVTVVPAFTVRRAGAKVKLSILAVASSARAAPKKKTTAASRQATPVETRELRDLTCSRPQPCSGLSMMASRCCPRTKFTSVVPSNERVWTSTRRGASIWARYRRGGTIMKKLSMLGIVGGAAILAAVPFSLQWSQGNVDPAVPLLMLSHANAQHYGPSRRHVRRVYRRAYRRAYGGYPSSYGGYPSPAPSRFGGYPSCLGQYPC